MPTTALPLVGLLLCGITPLPTNPDADPFALQDPFSKISAEELRTRWSLADAFHDDEAADADHLPSPSNARPSLSPTPTLDESLQGMRSLNERTFVDVRLVGFDSDGEHDVRCMRTPSKSTSTPCRVRRRSTCSIPRTRRPRPMSCQCVEGCSIRCDPPRTA